MSEEISTVIVLFGGSGDLARRKLYPALFGLFKRGVLKDRFAVIGTARRPWSDAYFREIVNQSVGDEPGANAGMVAAFSSHFYYQSHDVTDAEHYVALKDLAQKLDAQYQVGGNRLFYMAMAPSFFSVIAEHLKSESLLTDNGFNRLVIEKPFGHDYASAKALNDSITATFDESQIYRIDHYLGKEMTQALLALRFANPMFSTIWDRDHIQDIQITLAEAVGVEERAGYYETSGAIRDMVQNHIMQLLAYLTMDQPLAMTAQAVHEVKGNVFASLHPYTPEEAAQNFVRGQYGESTINGTAINGYRQENGVAPDSMTDTFVAGKILLDMPAFAGVPIYIRTGKRLTRKSSQVTVTFKPTAANLFGSGTMSPTSLTIYMDPSQGYSLFINGKELGMADNLEMQELSFRHDKRAAAAAPEAYERLLQDALFGDQTNFTRWSELADTWRYVDNIIAGWAAAKSPMLSYPVGTMGPQEAFSLLAKAGHQWFWQPTHILMAD